MSKFENITIHSEFLRASVVRLIFTRVRVSAEWLLKSLRPSVFPSAHMWHWEQVVRALWSLVLASFSQDRRAIAVVAEVWKA